MSKILLVDDDFGLSESIKDILTSNGFIVDAADSAEDAEAILFSATYSLIILDWMMPGMTGIEFLKLIRSKGIQSPVLMLTGRSTIDDKEAGFETGADDYLVKPFHGRELLARVKALVRRPAKIDPAEIRLDELVLDTRARSLHRAGVDGAEIALTKQEYTLLEFLMRHPNEVFSADALIERAWSSFTECSSDTVRVHIAHLRKKLSIGEAESPIKTLHRQGYAFMPKKKD